MRTRRVMATRRPAAEAFLIIAWSRHTSIFSKSFWQLGWLVMEASKFCASVDRAIPIGQGRPVDTCQTNHQTHRFSLIFVTIFDYAAHVAILEDLEVLGPNREPQNLACCCQHAASVMSRITYASRT